MTRQETAVWASKQGSQALAIGDLARAQWLLQYARAVQPHDLDLALLLGSVELRAGAARAIETFRPLAELHDLREGWFGMAAAAHRAGDAAAAASHLARGLSRHAPLRTPGFRDLAAQVARNAGAAGWCALTADGVLSLGLSVAGGQPSVQIDRLPPTAFTLDDAGTGVIPLGRRLVGRSVVQVRLGARHLLGSPILVSALTRLEGVVTSEAGGLVGWAWYPGDPDLAPDLVVSPVALGGPALRVTVPMAVSNSGRRRFAVPASALAGWSGRLSVQGRDRQPLLGSPLELHLEPKSALPAASVPGRPPRQRPVDVVIPVFGEAATTLACIDAVRASVPATTRIIVVDDASPEPDLVHALQDLAAQRHITLICNRRNVGFPASANAGIDAAGGHDVLLLNSDTLVANDWLQRLGDAAYAAGDIGTVTPLSNDASLVRYTCRAGADEVADVRQLDNLARQANGAETVDIPTGVGFCMYLRRDCLDQVGALRADVFAQGYGEENDFCRRAAQAGWRHVAATGVFVGHLAGRSFGAAATYLQERNIILLNRLHPGYDALITDFLARDPLRAARRRMDLHRWHAGTDDAAAVILITHDRGGGVHRHVTDRCAALRAQGMRPLQLVPTVHEGRPGCTLDAAEFPYLVFGLPDEADLLHQVLQAARPCAVELHHFIDHHPAILHLAERLGVALDIVVHDYAWFCPRVSLTNGRHVYCGEPAVQVCESCVAELGHPLGDIAPQALRDRSTRLFAQARRVIVPVHDTGQRMQRHFPALRPEIEPWEISEPEIPPVPAGPCPTVARICVAGAIGLHKGYGCLLALGKDAAARGLPIEFVLVGYSEDDFSLMQTGVIKVTGPFQPGQCVAALRAQHAVGGFLPSETPETWCYTLSEFWSAGLTVAAFDLGAQAERIRATGKGLLLTPGLPPAQINDTLLRWSASPSPASRGVDAEHGYITLR